MDTLPGPRKKPRIDTMNDDFWDKDEDFTPDVLAQVDLTCSQAFPQVANVSTIPYNSAGTPLHRHHSWSASPKENLLPPNYNSAKSKSSFLQPSRVTGNNQKPAVVRNCSHSNSPFKSETKSWSNASPFIGQNFAGASLQEIERQKQELKRLQEEKIKFQEEIKRLNEASARKDFEILAGKEKIDFLKQNALNEQNCNQEHMQMIEKLKTELEFQRQELISKQWKISQQQNHPSNNNKSPNVISSEGSQPKRKTFKSPLKVPDESRFPSQVTFEKRIELKEPECQPGNARKSNTTSSSTVTQQIQTDTVLKLKRPLGIGTGPALVGILLQQTEITLPASASLPPTNISREIEAAESNILPTQVSKFSWKGSLSLSNNKTMLQEVPSKPVPLDIMDSLIRLLEDDAARVSEESAGHSVPSDMNIWKICLGLRLDCAKEMLPAIDTALSSSIATCGSDLVAPNLTTPAHCSSRSPLPDQRNQNDDITRTSVQNAVSTLQVLKHLAYYSPSVRHCLILDLPNNGLRSIQEAVSPQQGTSRAPTVHPVVGRKRSLHLITQKLFKLCNHPFELTCISEAYLLHLDLEILTTVASYCSIDELARFLPLFSPRMLQNCTALALDGSILIQLIYLLNVICASPAVAEATCNQEDFCIWIPLSGAWLKARNELSQMNMLRLDNLMIQLLSLCVSHDTVMTPFLNTNEIHCQFEVVSSLILYLNRQQHLYEDNLQQLNVPTLRKGIALLHQVANRDVQFRHHRAQVNFEMFSFLHWLARVKKSLKIGPAADVLLEMWNIEAYIETESEEESPMDTDEFHKRIPSRK